MAHDPITRVAKQYKENATTRKERTTNKLTTTQTTQKQHNLLRIQ
jgi:hypothetical protein